MSPIKLRKAYSERGADMGRPTFLPVDRNVSVKLRLVRLRLDSGGYDSAGAYWGLRSDGNVLYWAESLEEFELGNYARPPVGTIEMAVEARNREQAKAKIRKELPNVTFYR